MEVDELREWMERLRMKGYERLSAATGLEPEQIGRWNRREEPIPSWVRLVMAAVYHRLDQVYP